MHRDDRPGAWRDRGLHRRWIDVERRGVDVHEHRPPTGVVNRPGRGEERIGSGDDFVAGTQIERFQRQEQGVRAGCAADPVSGVGQFSHPRFELGDSCSHDELLRFDDRLHGGKDLALDGPELSDQVQQRHVHVGSIRRRGNNLHRPSRFRQLVGARPQFSRRTCRRPCSGRGLRPRSDARHIGTSTQRGGPALPPSRHGLRRRWSLRPPRR